MIELLGIKKSYNGKNVLSGVDLVLSEPSFTSILGASGSGKTTLLRIIAGLERADEGIIRGIGPEDIACVFQEPRLFPWMNALENVACVISGTKKETHERALYWLGRAGLGTDAGKLPSELSGGMKQRVALVRALSSGRRVLLLDEAFKELDAETKTVLHELVKQETSGSTVICVTHDREEAEYFSRDLYILDPVSGLARIS